MIFRDVAQGSAEWFACRIGVPTASEFERIVTPTGKLSKQAHDYAFRVVTERLLNRTLESLDHLEWVERGKDLEGQAIGAYEITTGCITSPGGFVTTDDGRVGASPDRIVRKGGDPVGLLEIKCPSPQVHLQYLLGSREDAYKPQVQGQLLVTGLPWVDFFSYCPEMPPLLRRVEQDEPYIATLREALAEFCDLADRIESQARALGKFAARRRILTPATEAARALNDDIPDWVGIPPLDSVASADCGG
jgi:hypothetical protein